MHVRRLREATDLLLSAEQQYQVQSALQQVQSELAQVISQPNQPQYQTNLAAALQNFRQRLEGFRNHFSPAQMAVFEEIRATDIAIADIYGMITATINEN